MTKPLRTRFAPSPTGSLHVGGARTALYCWLIARQTKGAFVLRIEDTDQARSTAESAKGIARDMRWLTLDWDEGPGVDTPRGPYFQSQRLDLYNKYLDQLIATGHAYEAWETSAELTAMRDAAKAAKKDFRYVRQPYTDDDLARFKSEGRKPVIRLLMPQEEIVINDHVLGAVAVEAGGLDDIVIRKADGFPTYHFAVVIDDHHMEIDLIMRGAEHMKNTHKHEGIYRALGWTSIESGHLPTIHNPSGPKMSKRDKSKAAKEGARAAHTAGKHPKGDYTWLAEKTGLELDALTRFMKDKKASDMAITGAIAKALNVELPMIEVMDFRKGGYLPAALLNYLALLGWSPGDDVEIMPMAELIERFSVDRINRTGARFDIAKLTWMNGEYLKTMPWERLRVVIEQYVEVVPTSTFAALDDGARQALVKLFLGRANTLKEIETKAAFLFQAPKDFTPKAVKKHLLKNDGLANLASVKQALSASNWSLDAINESLNGLVTDDRPLPRIAQPLRVALSGTGASPGIAETLAFMDKADVLGRIDTCIEACTPQAS